MSVNHVRKPSAASETFITTLAVLFFVGLALLFQYLDSQKSSSNHKANVETSSPSAESQEDFSHDPGYLFPDISTDRHSGILNTENPIGQPAHSDLHAGVHPPLPSLDIKPQEFVVDAGSGLAFTSRHKSVVTIPTHAFLDKNGNKVTGKVDVKYREFYNYMDIFRSGIPMIFQSAGKEQQLESAGMFELTASKDNVPVYVNPENQISVMMASMNNNPDYNIYYFDKSTNQWVNKGPSISRVSQSESDAFTFTAEDSIEKKFYYNKPEYTIKVSGRWEPWKIKKSLFSTKYTPERFNFHFVFAKNSIPELNDLRTIVWRYSGPDSKELFHKVFNTRNGQGVWKNASLVHQEEDDTWLITLANDTFTTGFKIIPVLNSEKSIIKFQQTMSTYLNDQEARINRQKDEFAKFQSDTIAYFASNARFTKRTIVNSYNIVRQFQLDGFGVWNCDRQIDIPNAITLNISFKDENNQLVYPQMVYLVDKSLNTVFSYDNMRMKSFRFNPDAENLMWALFPGDVIAVVRPDEFKQKSKSVVSRCVFKVNLNKSAVITEKELKEQLAFDL